MRKLMNLILGMVELEVTAPFPERLINLCAQARIDFWAMDQLDEHTVRLTIRRYALDRFRALAERAGCEMVRRSSRGLPDLPVPLRADGGGHRQREDPRRSDPEPGAAAGGAPWGLWP